MLSLSLLTLHLLLKISIRSEDVKSLGRIIIAIRCLVGNEETLLRLLKKLLFLELDSSFVLLDISHI